MFDAKRSTARSTENMALGASAAALESILTTSSGRERLHDIDPLLSPSQTADYTGLTKPTLQRHRTDGTGPRFIKLGKRRVAYRLSDLKAWLEVRAATSTADARERGLTG
jgi:predicted DNA-binding transcriptional regulator AlpA